MLYDGGGKGVGHCPYTSIKGGGGWWEVLDTSDFYILSSEAMGKYEVVCEQLSI